tara:strand:+ start:1776 stop:2873 length:1098 start_codon:yes stop_codon:yes gene_type:complete
MATTFKRINEDNDVTSTRTLLHEAIPITSSIVSGTYGTFPDEGNIKNYTHGMYQSVYDYPFLSSSANHIFDISVGIHSDSPLSGATVNHTQISKKVNIYNQMAQLCMGYDQNGNIQKFDEDGNISGGGDKLNECIFINFSRLLVKDEIKRGTFNLKLKLEDTFANAATKKALIYDSGSLTNYKTNSPVGEYGILYAKDELSTPIHTQNSACGLIFYQAGICVLSSSVFLDTGDGGILTLGTNTSEMALTPTRNINDMIVSSSISSSADALRHRIDNISFNNTTELNSTIYFCRVNHNEFNYSANPTYLSGSKIRVKNDPDDTPVSYITSVGLYSSDGVLLATGKLSEPLKKEPSVEYTLRARLDY